MSSLLSKQAIFINLRKRTVAILFCYLLLLPGPSFAQDTTINNPDSRGVGYVLAGANHPYYSHDNIILPVIAQEMAEKSLYIDSVQSFATGMELVNILKSRQGISNLVVLGHSAHQGYFVEKSAGFYRDNYHIYQKGIRVEFAPGVAFLNDVIRGIQNGSIRFSTNAVIVLAGCNTASEQYNIAFDLARESHLPVVGVDGKLDFYHVEDRGEDLKGKTGLKFIFYFYVKDELRKEEIEADCYKVSELIEILRRKVKKK